MASRKELLEFLHQSLLSSSTGCLSIKSGEISGQLFIKDGQMIHAECPSFLGEEALWALLRAEPDDLDFTEGAKPKRETISRPTELILMESAIHIDQPEKRITADVGSEKTKDFFRITKSVQFDSDSDNPRKIFFLSAGVSSAGRSNSCDIIISDKTVSRYHAEFEVNNQEVIIRDMGGRNGTRVNGRQVKEARLSNNDSVSLGMVLMRFYWTQKGEPVVVQEPLSEPTRSATGPIKYPPAR
ncbi:MAG: FHA domain-containing protein [Candidatus Methylacidiphilales bacterium]